MKPHTWHRASQLSSYAEQHYSLSMEKRNLLYWCAAAAPKKPLFVEIGVCHGGTAMLLAYMAQCLDGRYVGIDNWSLEGSYEDVRRLLDSEDLMEPQITLIREDSTAMNTEEATEGYFIDLLLIDGGHQIGVVDKDCEKWIPRVAPGGLVCFDDYTAVPGLTHEQDCHWAVRESAELWTAEWETVGFWSGLLIRRKPA